MTTLKSRIFALLLASALFASPAIAEEAGKKGKNGPVDSLLQVTLAVNAEGPYAGSFDTLITAVLQADPSIIIALSKKGKRTVLAPTDDAFLALGLDETNIAGAFSREVLTDILNYHLLNERLFAKKLLKERKLKTRYKGKKSRLKQSGGTLIDNLDRTSTIIVTDVEASNGVIHVINNVLLPFDPAS